MWKNADFSTKNGIFHFKKIAKNYCIFERVEVYWEGKWSKMEQK